MSHTHRQPQTRPVCKTRCPTLLPHADCWPSVSSSHVPVPFCREMSCKRFCSCSWQRLQPQTCTVPSGRLFCVAETHGRAQSNKLHDAASLFDCQAARSRHEHHADLFELLLAKHLAHALLTEACGSRFFNQGAARSGVRQSKVRHLQLPCMLLRDSPPGDAVLSESLANAKACGM